MQEVRSHRAQVGVCAGDPLRSVGLCTILSECDQVHACAVDVLADAELNRLDALLVHSSCVADVIQAVARLRRLKAALRVVVVGQSADPVHIQSVIAAGAKGYLSDTASEDEIRMAIEVVLDGSVWAPRKVLARLIEAGGVHDAPGRAAGSVLHLLTAREQDVLGLLLEGRSNRQIAMAMGIEAVTVKAHLGRMMRKAHVKTGLS